MRLACEPATGHADVGLRDSMMVELSTLTILRGIAAGLGLRASRMLSALIAGVLGEV